MDGYKYLTAAKDIEPGEELLVFKVEEKEE